MVGYFSNSRNFKNRRIERYRIIVQDVENNISKAECLLIKEIHYDD